MAKTAANNYFGSGGTKRGSTYGQNASLKQDKPAIKDHGNTFGPGAGSSKSSDGYASTHSSSFGGPKGKSTSAAARSKASD